MRPASAALAVLCIAASAHAAARPAERTALLARAEAALARGDADAARSDFERAANEEHAADIELGLVRSLMQAGAYRQALAFAAHTAGAHGDEAGAAAVYAQLLEQGGLGAQATLPALPAPAASGDVPPPNARGVGSGVLVDAGRHALVPLAVLGEADALWLRNGLGRSVRARIEQRLDALGIALLRLDAPLAAAPITLPARDAFPGAPGHAVEFDGAAPAWPRLRSGFIGMPVAGGRRLGIELPAGPRGGPVFDAAGQLIGIALNADGSDRLLPVSALRASLGETAGTASAAIPRMPLDQIYENALRLTLQLIVTSRPGR
ncbi:MAG TPA: trypsin-like peptidase domain-containing protein [Albitalea sp.]|nr:trypsin-like peptidase domain-containing protein [Albitalea sp.]